VIKARERGEGGGGGSIAPAINGNLNRGDPEQQAPRRPNRATNSMIVPMDITSANALVTCPTVLSRPILMNPAAVTAHARV